MGGSYRHVRQTQSQRKQGLADPQNLSACRYSQAELEALDNQGRCIISDHRRFVLFNLYLPASTRPGQTNEAGDRYQHKLRMLQARPNHFWRHLKLLTAQAAHAPGALKPFLFNMNYCYQYKLRMLEARPSRSLTHACSAVCI